MNRTCQSLLVSLVSILVAATSPCGTTKFYSQAIHGQAEILGRARPAAEVLRDERVSDEVKRRLALTQEILRFAEEQRGLSTHRQYRPLHRLGPELRVVGGLCGARILRGRKDLMVSAAGTSGVSQLFFKGSGGGGGREFQVEGLRGIRRWRGSLLDAGMVS